MHGDHTHLHDASCPRPAVEHDGHVDEHIIAVTQQNPANCASHECNGHESSHTHVPGCGHEAVPHGDHHDYLVSGHLHHPHGSYCDDHGTLVIA